MRAILKLVKCRVLNELGPEGMADKRSRNLLSDNPPAEAVEIVKWNMKKTILHGGKMENLKK